MKKIILTAILFCGLALQTNSQTFAFFRNGVQLANNAEINISEFTVEDGAVSLESELEVHNLTIMSFNGVVEQHVVKAPENGTISFCFGNCYLTNNDLTLETSVAPTNTTALHVYFASEENAFASTQVEYTVYPKINATDKQTVKVNFQYTATSTTQLQGGINEIAVLRNNGNIAIKYNFISQTDHQIQILDLTGQVVARYTTKRKSGKWIPDRQILNGIYLVAVRDNNQLIITKKIVI